MLGASIYKNMSELSQEGIDERSVLAYIWTKSKNFNDADMIHVSEFSGDNALIINEVFGIDEYQTIIYHYNGWLYELFTIKNSGLGREDGVKVMPLEDLTFETANHGLIKISSGNQTLLINPLGN